MKAIPVILGYNSSTLSDFKAGQKLLKRGTPLADTIDSSVSDITV